jgi:hypothetical protein
MCVCVKSYVILLFYLLVLYSYSMFHKRIEMKSDALISHAQSYDVKRFSNLPSAHQLDSLRSSITTEPFGLMTLIILLSYQRRTNPVINIRCYYTENKSHTRTSFFSVRCIGVYMPWIQYKNRIK